MGLPRLFGVCAAFLFASSVNAAQTIDLGPSDWRRWGEGTYHHHTRGLNTKTGQTVRLPPMNTSLAVTRNAVVPYGSIVNGMRSFVRINPASIAASAAVTALFMGVDWAFDEARDSWMKEGIESSPELGDFHWYDPAAPGNTFSNPVELCVAITPPPFQEQYSLRMHEYKDFEPSSSNPSRGVCVYDRWLIYQGQPGNKVRATINVSRGGSQCTSPAVYYPQIGMCGVSGLVPLEASDWTQLEASLPASAPALVGGAANDAMKRQGAPLNGFSDMPIEGPSSVTGPETTSTTTDPVSGDTVVTTTNTTTNISYGDTSITTTNTTTSTTYQNGQETSTTVTTETPGELPVTDGGGLPPAGEWPGFCDWATVVCDWLNWTQEEPPPDVDLPQVIDDDFYNEKTISFGAKSCPPDYEINLTPFMETSVGVSFQPLCDFASLIYYMVMAASYIIAAYISIGVARNG